MLIGVTDETVEIVDAWMAQRKPTYPIVILRNREFESALGVKGFPTAAVIAPDGTLIYSGYSAESALKEAMSKAEKGSLWPKKLERVASGIRKGDLAGSYADLKKVLAKGGLDEAEQKAADKMQAFLEGRASGALESARKLFEDGMVYAAMVEIEPFAGAKEPFPVSEDARELVSELEALEDFKKEMKGGEDYASAQALELQKEYTEAIDTYRSILKRYDSTKIADRARASAQDLIDKGLAGYAKACPTCQASEKACSKHAETIKL